MTSVTGRIVVFRDVYSMHFIEQEITNNEKSGWHNTTDEYLFT